MKVNYSTLGEEATSIVRCDDMTDFMNAIDALSPDEMRRALVNLAVFVTAQRMREAAAGESA